MAAGSEAGDGVAAAAPPSAVPADAASAGTVLELRHAAKSFGPVKALIDGSVELRAGAVHALLGENGAGKSTLVKILAGVYQPDSGQLLVGGEEVTLHGPAAARAAGIAVIYQEPMLFPDLTVAENIFMGRQPVRAGRRIDRVAMNRDANAIFAQLGVALDPARPARGLSVADQQIVEIAKALSLNARVMIMDEPTASLSSVEVERLFRVIAALRARGAAVMFISHRLEEVFAICQQVTIMRDGKLVMTAATGELDVDTIIRSMIGRDLGEMYHKTGTVPGELVLAVGQITRDNVFYDVSFNVRRGEVVALAGLVGAGRSEVARAIFGIDRRSSGSVRLLGKELPNGDPAAAMAAGIAFVPEDRRQQGLVMDLAIDHNVALASLSRLSNSGLIFRAAERRLASTWAQRLHLKYGRMRDRVATLSGGNQQKVVLGKWLSRSPSLLIIDEPTRGIDVGTKAEVHRIIDQLAAEGMAVLMISSELPEVLGVADRILVIHEGRLTGEFTRADATEDKIMRAASGLVAEEAA